MTQAQPVSQEDFAPFILRQAGLRASLLKTSFGLATEDWDDMRQDLAFDCLRRLPRFDPARGDWQRFVHGVVRNHASVLASRQARQSLFARRRILTTDDVPLEQENHFPHEAAAEDLQPALELRIDVRRVLAGLPEDLQSLAVQLSELSLHAVCRNSGLTRSELVRKIGRIRAAFAAAGLAPHRPGKGGQR